MISISLIVYLLAVLFFICAGATVTVFGKSPRWEWFGIACVTLAFFVLGGR